MSHNRKVLKIAVDNLDKAKAPAKPKDVKILNQNGQRNYPGQVTEIQGDTMATDGYGYIPLMVFPNNGQGPQLVMPNTGKRKFDGATKFVEYPVKYPVNNQDIEDDHIGEYTEKEIEAFRAGGYIVEDISVPSVGNYKQGGSLLTKKVTCKKCGWKWDAADGGDDLTTCHKCGGEGLVHAKKGGGLKKYSRSLEATNKLFHDSPLLKKAKSKKKKIFDPSSSYFQDGGQEGPRNQNIDTVDTDAMNAMMKARMATSAELGNPSAQRMVSPNPKTYDFGNDNFGTHYMSSIDNYAVPLLQDKGGNELEYNENPEPSNEDMRFETPEEANYFAEHYKEIAPMMNNFDVGGIPNLPLREGRAAYERLSYTDNDRMAMAAEGGTNNNNYIEVDADDNDIANYIAQGYQVEELPKAQYAGQTPFVHPDAGATNVLFQKPTATKPNSKYNKNTPVNYQAKLKPVIADNTKDVTANNAVVAKQVNDYMATDEYKAKQKAEKEAQAQFEKEQWDKYNKMSFGEKVSDRTNAALNQPLLMASNLIMGDQAYIPGMASGLGDGGPDYDKWLKATGQTRGIGVNDIFSAVNPGNWGGHAGRQFGEGNYLTGAGELGLGLLGLKGAPLMGNQLAKSSAKGLINLEQKAGQAYNKVATGNSRLPYAWKSPMQNVTQESSEKLFNNIAQSNKFTNAEKQIISEYANNSYPFTGRFNYPINEIKKTKLQEVINKAKVEFPEDIILSRKINADNSDLFNLENNVLNLEDRPTSFSSGIGTREGDTLGYGNNAKDRIVISGKNAKAIESNFLKNPYQNPSQEYLQGLNSNEHPYGFLEALNNRNYEKELIGSGLNLKKIGKVKNDIGGFDYIMKPNTKAFKELPGSPNAFTRSGLGGMDMSKYEIKNPDYFTQLLDTYDSKVLSSSNKKFYKDLIESVKKQEGLVTERQYNELQRLKTGNFNFGKKGYKDGGSLELDLTPEEIQAYKDGGYIVEDID